MITTFIASSFLVIFLRFVVLPLSELELDPVTAGLGVSLSRGEVSPGVRAGRGWGWDWDWGRSGVEIQPSQATEVTQEINSSGAYHRFLLNGRRERGQVGSARNLKYHKGGQMY